MLDVGTFVVAGAPVKLFQVGLCDMVSGLEAGVVVKGYCCSVGCKGSNRRCIHRADYNKAMQGEDWTYEGT